MLARAILALGDPGAFFRWLAGGSPRMGAAAAVLLLGSLASNGASALMLLHADTPQAQRAQTLLSQTGVSTDAVALALVISAPLVAMITWVLVWAPIRLGAGAAERLWEVAAWSQLPQLLVALAHGAVALVPGLPLSLSTALGIVSIGWCAWFVYAGVLHLGRGNALRAAIVYAACWAVPALLGLLLAQGGTVQSSGTLMS